MEHARLEVLLTHLAEEPRPRGGRRLMLVCRANSTGRTAFQPAPRCGRSVADER